jgi:hypothetical protein
MAYESEMELELEEELGGLGEFEQPEGEWEQPELTPEFEGDQFFGRLRRIGSGIGRFVRKLPLKQLVRMAAPIVGTAIGGPFGAVLGRVASQALREEEFEQHELAHEFEHPELAHEFEQHEFEQHEFEQPELAHEFEQHELAHEFEQHEFENPELAHEFEHPESSQEVAHEIAQHETTHHEALAEIMAEMAVHEHHEAQAEAMMGAAVVSVLSPRDRRALRRLMPNFIRGMAVLTRILRRRTATRSLVRAVPTIMRRTVASLKRQAAAGKPVTRRAAGRAAATEVRRVLGSPSACAAAIRQNVRSTRRSRANGKARY